MVNTPEKPTNQKGKSSSKSIYFNLDDPDELRLYEYAKKIKNFSGHIKAVLHAEFIKNNGQAPSPYSYTALMQSSIAAQKNIVDMDTYRNIVQAEVAATTIETSIPTPEKVEDNSKDVENDNESSYDENPLNDEESQNEDDLGTTDTAENEEDNSTVRPKAKNISLFTF